MRAWVAALVVLVALAGLYWPTLRMLFDTWMTSGNYSHGPVVALLALYWAACIDWTPAFSRRTAVVGGSLCFALGAVWLAASAAKIEAVQQGVWPALLWAALLGVFGWRVARALAPSFALLLSAVPLWDYARPPLQALTARAVDPLTGLWGVPVLVEGNFVQVPAGTFEIAGGCSGLRFVIVAEVVAFCFAQLNGLGRRTTALLMLAAFGVAVVTNIARVTLIILVGNASQMTHPWVEDHAHVGWVMFAIALVPFLWFAVQVRDRSAETPPKFTVLGGAPSARVAWISMAGVLVLGVAPAWAWYWQHSALAVPAVVDLPTVVGEWRSDGASPVDDWKPLFKGAAAEMLQTYHRADSTLLMYSSVYSPAHPADPLDSENSALGDWRVLRRSWHADYVELEARSGAVMPWLVRYWYIVGEESTARSSMARLYQGIGAFRSPRPSGVVAVATACHSGCEAASRDLDTFLSALRSPSFSETARNP